MSKVLIAYVTKTGTTAHAAEIISSVLKDSGHTADVMQMDNVRSLEGYDSFIFGAPINGMNWRPDAAEFLKKHESILIGKDVSLFCMTYIYAAGSSFWKKSISNAFTRLKSPIVPRMTGFFAGKVDQNFPAFARVLFGVKKGTAIDLRDDESVRVWAREWVKGL